tara:strand:- start:128380 stop:128817 length:438 start_codon:yes stop_codon:yes gene_type:complete
VKGLFAALLLGGLGVFFVRAPAFASETWEVYATSFPGTGDVVCYVTSPNTHVRFKFFRSREYVQRTLEFVAPITQRLEITAQIGDKVFKAPGNDVFYWTAPAIKTAILDAPDMTVSWTSPAGVAMEKQVDLADFKDKYRECAARI